ncbi:hypothetical protein DITRI_Ditri04bG0035700 [Diplodiscus trichospermus]
MVSASFFSFVLVFILVLIGESSAHSQGIYTHAYSLFFSSFKKNANFLNFSVMGTAMAAAGTSLESARRNLAESGKEAYDAVPAAAEVWNSRLEGRKMMPKWVLDRKTVTVEGSDEEQQRAKVSGADYQSVGKRSLGGKGILNVNRKLRNRNSHPHRHGKPKMAGFTAFSADYHVPKSHPPKNN